MAVEVLPSRAEIDRARRELDARGWSSLTPPWRAAVQKWSGQGDGVRVGDRRKSWDVWKTLGLLAERVPRTAPVLDIGCYGSEVVCSLPRLGYRRLHGLDLNPELGRMPARDVVHYEVGSFLDAPFRASAFEAITAVSVIEHGFDGDRLIRELSRLLAPGGCFVASFDYWPDKVDTSGVRLFDLEWTIFSAAEVQAFLTSAESHGMRPLGEIHLEAREKPIQYGGFAYTFGWMALVKEGR